MVDDFDSYSSNLSSPASCASAVAPSDSETLATTRALWVGGAGDLTVEMKDGGTVTFASVMAGSLLPLRVAKVMETGTSASSIVALW